MIANGPRHEKNCLRGVANKKGADQPALPRSLFSAFVICLLETIIFRLAMSEISILVSVGWLNIRNPEERFSSNEAQMISYF